MLSVLFSSVPGDDASTFSKCFLSVVKVKTGDLRADHLLPFLLGESEQKQPPPHCTSLREQFCKTLQLSDCLSRNTRYGSQVAQTPLEALLFIPGTGPANSSCKTLQTTILSLPWSYNILCKALTLFFLHYCNILSLHIDESRQNIS